MPSSTSSTDLSIRFATTESSSYDSHSFSDEPGNVSHYMQLLEDIPEDAHDPTDIGTWIQRAELQMLQLFGKELVALIDRSIQEINREHGQARGASDMRRLLKLAVVITMLPTSPDLLPVILRLYATLGTFPIDQLNGITKELRKCVRKILRRVCSLSQTQSGLYHVAQRGGVHKITLYVMNYVKFLWEHDSVINNIIAYQADGESENGEEWTQVDSFVQHFIGRLDALLERMARHESMMGLECISLLNNAHFILNRLRKLEVKSALQQDWILRYENQVKHQITRYLELSWLPVMSCLDAHTPTQALFPCFHLPLTTRFYEMLESTCAEQQNWRIEDPKLRNNVRKAVSSHVVQCYQAHLQKKGMKLHKYIPQEIENKLMELFQG